MRRAKDNPVRCRRLFVVKRGGRYLEKFGRDAVAVIRDFDYRVVSPLLDGDCDLSVLIDGLQGIEQKIQQHLVNLIAVVLTSGSDGFLRSVISTARKGLAGGRA